jgi:hypothetical protein
MAQDFVFFATLLSEGMPSSTTSTMLSTTTVAFVSNAQAA